MQNLNVMVFEIVLESAQWALLEAEHSSTVYSTFISTVLQFSSGKSTCSYFKSSVAVNHLASHFPTAGTLGSSLSWQPLMQLSCFFLQTDRDSNSTVLDLLLVTAVLLLWTSAASQNLQEVEV